MVPIVGETMDIETMLNSQSTTKEQIVAGLSLGINIASAGFLPNFGKTAQLANTPTPSSVGRSGLPDATTSPGGKPDTGGADPGGGTPTPKESVQVGSGVPNSGSVSGGSTPPTQAPPTSPTTGGSSPKSNQPPPGKPLPQPPHTPKPPRIKPEDVTPGMEVNPKDHAIFRGGNELKLKPGEFKTDPTTGNVKPKQGPSVNTNPHDPNVQTYGGANQIESIPPTLKIIQRGTKPHQRTHFHIEPREPMTPDEFQRELSKVKLYQDNDLPIPSP